MLRIQTLPTFKHLVKKLKMSPIWEQPRSPPPLTHLSFGIFREQKWQFSFGRSELQEPLLMLYHQSEQQRGETETSLASSLLP